MSVCRMRVWVARIGLVATVGWTVPDQAHQIAEANQSYPHRPLEPAKAWKEMVHRYFAGTV
jgi:heme A synthase